MYKTIIIPVKCNKTDYKYLSTVNQLSGQCWNYCVEVDKEHYKETGKYMTMMEMQRTVKGCVPLHAKGIYHVYRKYLFARTTMFNSIKAKHETSDKVKLPYKKKKFFNTGWDYQSIVLDYEKGIIKLSRKENKELKKRPKAVKCYAKTIPQNIVEIELLYRNGLKLAIKYKEEDLPKREYNNVAAIDLGEIHSITSIDNNGNAVIITGRKIRSIKRFQNKEQAKLRSKRDKLTKGSRQYKKYSRAIYKLSYKTDKQILDCVHKISKLYLDYCLENKIGTVYYGDLDSCTRNTHERVNKVVGQKLNDWCYGLLTLQLENKLSRYGIEMIKVSEAYSSQTCPHCGKRHKPTNRNYECKCGYIQHRDIVGSINILNFNEKDVHIEQFETKKYLRIA